MNQVKILAINKKITLSIFQFVVLVGIAFLAPLFLHQAITGPIVNATLFISVLLVGVEKAVLVGLIPSLIALSVGLLPSILAPIIPFIMVGNTFLILVFNHFGKKNYWLGVILASFLKFLFLLSTNSIFINIFLKKDTALKAAAMMSYPQFFTALAGGLISYVFLRGIKKF